MEYTIIKTAEVKIQVPDVLLQTLLQRAQIRQVSLETEIVSTLQMSLQDKKEQQHNAHLVLQQFLEARAGKADLRAMKKDRQQTKGTVIAD